VKVEWEVSLRDRRLRGFSQRHFRLRSQPATTTGFRCHQPTEAKCRAHRPSAEPVVTLHGTPAKIIIIQGYYSLLSLLSYSTSNVVSAEPLPSPRSTHWLFQFSRYFSFTQELPVRFIKPPEVYRDTYVYSSVNTVALLAVHLVQVNYTWQYSGYVYSVAIATAVAHHRQTTTSRTFPWPMWNSLTFPGYPCVWPPWSVTFHRYMVFVFNSSVRSYVQQVLVLWSPLLVVISALRIVFFSFRIE